MHLLDMFHFCPKCGSKNFHIHTPSSKKCTDCGFEYFKNPSIGVGIIVLDDQERILCIQRESEPKKGFLALPGGFAECNETIEETAIREVKEETNVDIEIEQLLMNYPNTYVYKGFDYKPLDFYFLAKIKNASDIKPQEGESSNIRFIPQDQLDIEAFAFDSTKYLLRHILPLHRK